MGFIPTSFEKAKLVIY